MPEKPDNAFISYVPGPLALRMISKVHTALYRMTGGSLGHQLDGLDILLLTTIGFRTGKHYQTPMPYFQHPGGFLLIASNAGQKTNPGWYYNLIHQPGVEIQIRRNQIQAFASILEGDEREAWWSRLIDLQPRYIQYQQTTTRLIPLVLLEPKDSE